MAPLLDDPERLALAIENTTKEIYTITSTVVPGSLTSSSPSRSLDTSSIQSRAESRSELESPTIELELKPFPVLNGNTDTTSIWRQTETKILDEKELHLFCDKRDVNAASVVHAAWAVCLQLYTGSDHVAFGIPSASSNAEGLRRLISCPVQLHKDLAVEDLVKLIHAHQTRSDGTTDSADIFDGFDSEFDASIDTAVIMKPESVAEDNLAHKDLKLKLHGQPNNCGLEMSIWYQSSAFAHAQAVSVLQIVLRIIKAIVHDSSTVVGSLAPVQESDFDTIVADAEVIEIESTIPHIIDQQTSANPHAPAIYTSTTGISYIELQNAIHRLAAVLVRSGVQRGDFVPLCMEKTPLAVVAMIAIMQIGAAFVPLDPSYPVSRIQSILEDTKATRIILSPRTESLGQELVIDTLIADESVFEVQSLKEPIPSPTSEPFSGSISEACSDATAYVLFTSGSTGRPKGVVVSHKNICSSMNAHAKAMCIDSTTRVLQFAAFTFDASICEIFTILSRGGCISMPSDGEKMNDLTGFINRARVNWAFFTPSVIRLIEPASVPTLTHLVLGGEALGKDNIATWSDKVLLWNGFGPTETCVFCVTTRIVSADHSVKVIGKPIGSKAWIVHPDDPHRLMPPGIIGELVIEGPLVSRGYLNRPEQTDDAFVEDLQWTRARGDTGRRMYRTGDLVQQAPDGSLTYLGRKDHQVKVNGQRMELGEVESALTGVDLVKDSVAHVPLSGPMAKRLVVVLTLLDDEEVNNDTTMQIKPYHQVRELKSHMNNIQKQLNQLLPKYMIPSIWVLVNKLPLLSSGKLNRKEVAQWLADLNEPDAESILNSRQIERDNSPPGQLFTELEGKIMAVWSRVLNVPLEKVSLDREFLSLGGDSISAMQIVSQCRKEDITITVQDILARKTISRLAAKATNSFQSADVLTIKPEEIDVPFQLSPIQKLFFDAMPDGQNHYNQSFVLQFTRDVTSEQVRACFQEIVRRHSMLRARFSKNEKSEWQQRIVADIASSFRYQQSSVLELDEMSSICSHSQRTLDIKQGPLMAVEFVAVKDELPCLFVTVHHLVIDLVSWRIILQQVEDMLETGNLMGSPSLSFQTWTSLEKTYSVAHLGPRDALREKVLSPRFDYWGMEDRPNLFRDVAREIFTIDTETTSLLLGTANVALSTRPREIMIGALLHAFTEVMKDRSLPPLFVEGHGRESWTSELDISATVGWFTTIFPIQITGSKSAIDTIRSVKDVHRGIRDKGWAYFTSRYMNPEGMKAFHNHDQVEISFDYIGVYQQLEHKDAIMKQLDLPTIGGRATDHSDLAPRISLIEITASVNNGKLQVMFEYNQTMRHTDKIRRWIQQTKEILNYTTHQLKVLEPQITLSDIPLAPLSEEELPLLQERIAPVLKLHGVHSNDIEDIYPCAPMQEGILVSRAKDQGYYNVQWTIELVDKDGPIDSRRLEDAWQAVVNRHPMLRTAFVDGVNNQNLFLQVVLKQVQARLNQVDADDLGSLEKLESPIWLEGELPYSLSWCLTPAGSAYIRMDADHSLIDGSTMPILLHEIQKAYEGSLSREPGPCYRDFIAWLEKNPGDRHLGYWNQYLSGVDPCEFPSLHEAPGHDLGRHQVVLPGNQIRDFCAEFGCTVATLLQLAWAIILRQYIDSEDVCFGYLASGRDVPVEGAEDMVGPLINMLVCRLVVEENVSMTRLLRQLQADSIASLAHQYVPLGKLHEQAGLNGRAMFNTVINVQRLAQPDKNAAIQAMELNQRDPSEYSVSLNLEDQGGQSDMTAVLFYWTSWLSHGQAANLASTLAKVVESIVQDPNQTYPQLQIVSDYHKHQMLQWNSEPPLAFFDCIHDLVSRQVLRQPDRLAAVSLSTSLTYRQLDEMSTRFGHYLVSKGVTVELIVPYCMDKSPMAIVIMLGILKAGGACLGLDPSQPKDRLQTILEETEATLVVCQRDYLSLYDDMSASNGQPILLLPIDEAFWEHDLPMNFLQPCSAVAPTNRAFITFTSGSTGKPKGIVIQHDSMGTSIYHHGTVEQVKDTTRTFQFSNFIFDVSIEEVFTTLCFGGCVCVPTEAQRMNDLSGAIRALEVNWTHLTPTVASLINPADVPGLKTLVLGGEPIPPDLVSRWTAAGVKVIATYGPAECSITCAGMEVTPDVANVGLMGHAAGAHLWVVDSQDVNKLVPIGCRGELLIEGPLLGRGYLDPEKTRQAWIYNPGWTQSIGELEDRPTNTRKDRLFYRSGDMVRLNSDGSLRSAGRKDNQVKVHGQRVEVGEVEHHLLSTGEILRHVLVTVPQAGPWAQKLVSVFSLRDYHGNGGILQVLDLSVKKQVDSRVSQLRTTLETKVPIYMVPSIWVGVEGLPLNTSGKIFRRSVQGWLEHIDEVTVRQVLALTLSTSIKAPVNEMESRLQEIWGQILDIPASQIGTDQSFVRLGGDSISAMQLVSASKNHGIFTTMRDIMQCKTIAELAQVAHFVDVSMNAEQSPKRPSEVGVLSNLSPIQKMHFKIFPNGQNRYNQSTLAEITRPVSVDYLMQCLDKLVEVHAVLRARFYKQDDGSWRQMIITHSLETFAYSSHEGIQSLKEAIPLLEQAQEALDVSRGPIFAAKSLHLTGGQQYIYLVAHHLVVDIVSWHIIVSDLNSLLQQETIYPEPVTMTQWSDHLQELAQSTNDPTAVLPHVAEFPLPDEGYWGLTKGRLTPAVINKSEFILDPPLTSLLLGSANNSLRTEPVELMIAVLLHTFAKTFTDRPPAALFIEGHGREPGSSNLDLSRTVGWFTTMTPLSIPQDEDLIRCIARVCDLRRRIPNNGLDYFNARWNSPQKSDFFNQHDFMEILFNYHGVRQTSRPGALLNQVLSTELPSDMDRGCPQPATFDINAFVSEGSFRIQFEYHSNLLHQRRIEEWISQCETVIRQALPRLAAQPVQWTLKDFPIMKSLEYDNLEVLKTQLQKIGLSDIGRVEDIYPCSPMQQGILFGLVKTEGLYQVIWVGEATNTKKSGNVNIQRLATAWQAVVDRHAILRTIFLEGTKGRDLFLQIVLSRVRANIDIIDDNLEWTSDELAAHIPHRLVLSEASGKAHLRLEISHAILDGTSTSILIEDLMKAYENTLPTIPATPYGDFIDYLSRRPSDTNIAFWKDHLQGLTPCLFPKLLREDETPGTKHQLHYHKLHDATGLRNFCAQNDVTIPSLVQLTWAIILSGFSGNEDVCFGTLASGRDVAVGGIHEIAGPLINMIITRSHLNNKSTIVDTLHQMHANWIESLAHQHSDLGEIHHQLQLGGQQLFNSVVNYQRQGSSQAAGQEITILNTDNYDPSEYDVSINVDDFEGQITLVLGYWPTCLNEQHARNVADTIEFIIHQIIRLPDVKLGELRLCSDAQFSQMTRWNDVDMRSVDSCIHQIILGNCKNTPEKVAITSTERSFTYAEVDAFSTRVAHRLISLGVVAGSIVPFCFNKSPWTIIAMIATHKAGGAIAAIDPHVPASRRELILAKTDATVVICQPEHSEKFDPSVIKTLPLSEALLQLLPNDYDKPLPVVSPTQPAIIAFTSGSTGQPKGIVLEHRNICTSMYHNGNLNKVSSETRSLQFASYTFDISTNEIFGVLGRGGTVCVPTDDERTNDLAGIINRLGVNWLDIPPAVAEIIDPAQVPGVKTIVLGGEAIAVDVVDRWLDHAAIVASYGPAEASVACGGGLITSRVNVANLLGWPSGAALWVVDAENPNRLMPIGCRGELVIEGALVSRGYLKEPEKTSQAFISNPKWTQAIDGHSVRRMYRSGDMARFEADGTMTYLGRADDQIKHHGFRIELGEIEHHLGRSGEMKHVVVFLPKAGPLNNRLVAVVSPTELSPHYNRHTALKLPNPEDRPIVLKVIEMLNSALSAALPAYMVPESHVVLQNLPLNASGKIDRRAVAQFIEQMDDVTYQAFRLLHASESPVSYIAPQNQLQLELQGIWCTILGLPQEQVGIRQSFISLGGDSVSAMKLIAELRKRNFKVTVQDVLQCRTIDQLATRCHWGTDDTDCVEPKLRSLLHEKRIQEELLRLQIDITQVETAYECSPIQEGMLLSQVRDKSLYNIEWIERAEVRPNQAIDAQRIETAWKLIVARHQALRTVFLDGISVDGTKAQLVLKDCTPQIRRVFFTNLEEFSINDEPYTPVKNQPPHCLTICQCPDNSVFLKFEINHAIFDGVSRSIVWNELSQAYDGSLTSELAPRFDNFIAYLQGRDMQASLSHWESYLGGLERCHFPVLDPIVPRENEPLAVDFLVAGLQVFDLAKFCRQQEITFAHLFQTAWALVLRTFIGSDDVCFGYLSSGRDVPVGDAQLLVGPLINMLICHLDGIGSSTFSELLTRVREDSIESLAHQHCSLADIHHRLKLGSDSLFNTAVTVLKNSGDAPDSSLQLSTVGGRGGFTEFALVLDIQDLVGDLQVNLTYSTKHLSQENVSIVADTLRQVLRHMVSSPSCTWDSIDLVHNNQLQQISSVNEVLSPQHNACIHELFQHHAQAQPSKVAIVSSNEILTYGELDDFSGRIAENLIERGVQPHDIVPFSMKKSSWAIAVMLGILKTGSAFLPIDPKLPAERIALILRNISPSVLITSPELLQNENQLPKSWASVALDQDVIRSLPTVSDIRLPPVSPEDSAYVLFTSGSTGEPKGIVVPHFVVSTSAKAHGDAMAISESTRALQFSSYSFDAAICEIFTTLQAGGTICVPTEDEKMNHLSTFMKDMLVNWAFFTPTVLRLLRPCQVPDLQTLVVGGEKVGDDNIELWHDKVHMMNGYGPTETCVFAVTTHLTKGCDSHTIGKAIGSRAWVVDPDNHDRLLPYGAVGELIIEGPIVSAGYFNSPQQTAEVFIGPPHWANLRQFESLALSKSRFYKTGDLVRQRPDGTCFYMGRKDFQVKINGQRLELGEIEQQAFACVSSDIQLVIDIVSSSQQKPYIAAFIHSPREKIQNINPDNQTVICSTFPSSLQQVVDELHSNLRARLPSYMIPAHYFPLNDMPLTSGGKVDRRLLKAQSGAISAQDRAQFRPSRVPVSKCEDTSPLQLVIRSLWADVLGIPPDVIDHSDDFFALGGDSVGAMKLAAVARSNGLSVSVADIFTHPSLSALSKVVQSLKQDTVTELEPFSLIKGDKDTLCDEASRECGVARQLIEDIYPCTHLQEGLIALSAEEKSSYVLQHVESLPGDIDINKFQAAWQTLSESHHILRTRMFESFSQRKIVQAVIGGDLVWHAGNDLQEYLDTDLARGFTFGDPLVRFAIIQDPSISPCKTSFVFTAHHASYDGWSLPRIFGRVRDLYYGRSPSLVPAFSNFIQYVSSLDLLETERYWRTKLDGIERPTWPSLPSPSYRPIDDMSSSLTMPFHGNGAIGITPSILIRAAWSILLSKYAGSNDVVFGASLAGRNAPVPGIMDIPGPTITTVPLRVCLGEDEPVHSLMKRLQNEATTMIPHEHIGLQHIQQVSAYAHSACEFQSLLAVQPVGDDRLASLFNHASADDEEEVQGTLTYAFTLICELAESRVRLKASFDSRCVTLNQCNLILQQMRYIIAQLETCGSAMTLRDLDAVSPSDKALLCEWNHLPLEESSAQTVLDLIPAARMNVEQTAEIDQSNPIAVYSWDGEMTYGELDALSTRLALFLVKSGICAGHIVPLCFDKSKWNIVAMLAVMKTGAAFIPLDPSHPTARKNMFIEATKATALLCGASHSSQLRELVDSVFEISQAFFAGLKNDATCTLPVLHSSQPIYVIFTSGSTGIPKGVVIDHLALLRSVEAHSQRLGMSSKSRVLHFASHTFDLSIFEILTTLSVGGCVAIPSEHNRLNDLPGFMRLAAVNFAMMTPSVALTLDPNTVPGLEVLALGGEGWGENVVELWKDHVQLYNAYGPSEAAIIAAIGDVDVSHFRKNNIGHAVGAIAWVTDPNDHHRLMPIGCVGELLLEGHTLAQCYLNDPVKTNAAFVSTPKWAGWDDDVLGRALPNRLYRTGDLVRYEDDGTMVVLGRKDAQVKVRGQRLELAEVEHQLSAHPSVRSTVVTIPKTGSLKDQLVATLSLIRTTSDHDDSDSSETIHPVPGAASAAICDEIRSSLGPILPEYMIPTTWLAVKRIPLLLSGKTSRKAVASWVESLSDDELDSLCPPATSSTCQLPTTPTEETLRDIWAHVLNRAPDMLSTEATFTSVGGDSVSAMLVVSRCRQKGMILGVRDILRERTIKRIAAVVTYSPKSDAIIIQPEIVDQLFALSPIQQLFFELSPEGQNQFNQSFLLEVRTAINIAQLQDAINAVVNKHGMLRARFEKDANLWKQRVTLDTAGSYRLCSHIDTDDETIATTIANSQKSLNIVHGPLFAVDHFHGNNKPILFLTIHHLVVDLVSWRIILQDLEDYLVNNAMSSIPSHHFQGWLAAQAEHAFSQPGLQLLNEEELDFQSYWNTSGISNTYGDVDSSSFTIPSAISSILLGPCNEAFSTEPLDLFIAGLLHSFSLVFTDRPAPTVFNEGHGREPWSHDIDINDTVGWFTTMAPVKLEISPEAAIFDVVKRVKDSRRSLVNNGLDHFVHSARTGALGPMEILVNYSGLFQQLEKDDAYFKPISLGDFGEESSINPVMKRFALFDILIDNQNGDLSFTILYNRHISQKDRIFTWFAQFESGLKELATVLPDRAQEPTLSNYSLAKLDYGGLSKLATDMLPRLGLKNVSSDVEDILLCSAPQQLILNRQSPETRFWKVNLIFELTHDSDSPVCLNQLRKAWTQVVRRHSVLRSIFTDELSQDGQWRQLLLRDPTFTFIEHHCRSKALALRSLERLGYLSSSDEPFRIAASKSVDGHVFCRIDINHAITDHASFGIVLRDFQDAYNGASFKDPASSYHSFVKYSTQHRTAESSHYWADYLNHERVQSFPTLSSLSAQDCKTVNVPISDMIRVRSFCEKHHLTLFNLLQPAWALLLQKYTQSSEVRFDYLLSQRDAPIDGVLDLVGLTISILPSSRKLQKTTTLLELVQDMQTELVEGSRHSFAAPCEGLADTLVNYRGASGKAEEDSSGLSLNIVSAQDPMHVCQLFPYWWKYFLTSSAVYIGTSS